MEVTNIKIVLMLILQFVVKNWQENDMFKILWVFECSVPFKWP